MDTAIVQQFLEFFQDFLHLCQLQNWPDNDTSEHEIRNAFLIAQHIGKCLDRFQTKDLLNEFLSTLNSNQDTSQKFLKNCFADPPKYILKKIINSKTKINQMDVGFRLFLELFSEEQLENYLTDLMVEAASKDALLRALTTDIPKEKQIFFKSLLLLSELNFCENPKQTLSDLLQNINQDTIEILVVSLLNKDSKYHKAVNSVVNAFILFMSKKNHADKTFWKLLFNVKDEYFIKMALEHGNLFKIMTTALLDCSKLLTERMSAEYFYIDLTYSELVFIVQKICKNDNLKEEFFDIVRESDLDVTLWENMVS